MSYKKRERKRFLKKGFRISLISFILLYLIFRSAPIILANNLKTTLSQVSILKKEFQSEGVIIRKEEVFKFDGQGVVDIKIDEGERVAVGLDIANLNFLKDTSGLRYQLEEIENAINVLSDKGSLESIFEKDKDKILSNREELVNNIQSSINKGNFKDITFSNNQLFYLDNKESQIFRNESLLKESLKALEEKKEFIKNRIEDNNISYKTESSGIISYEIDGYENIFLPKDFENYTYDNLNFPKTIETNENFNGFKIIDNFIWYLALKINDVEDINTFKENDLMNINFQGFDKNIDGRIIKINRTDKNAVAILKFNRHFLDYYKIRFSKINIIKFMEKGYKIPNDAVIKKDNQDGVYIKDFNGIVKFRPILIIGEEGEFVFVDMGKSGYIDIPTEEDSIKTIGLYDEIFLKPDRIQEGQIIN